MRLKTERRVPLDAIDGVDLSARLFGFATKGGARSLGLPVGELAVGRAADFFAIDLHDVAIAGVTAKELLPMIVFSLDRAAVTDVFVGGKAVVSERRHALAGEIVARYEETAQLVQNHEMQQ